MKAELQNPEKSKKSHLVLSKMRRLQKIPEHLYLTSESLRSRNTAPLLDQTFLT